MLDEVIRERRTLTGRPESLSAYERQQLINQYKILELLDKTQRDYYRECQRILQEGYSILYPEVFETWAEMSIEECRYVFDVLDMFRILKYSYERLSDKAGLTPEDIRFAGFDGNNESKNLALLEFLREQGRWQETLGEERDFNSHSISTVHLYPKMLQRWQRLRGKHEAFNLELDADEIKYVLHGGEEPRP